METERKYLISSMEEALKVLDSGPFFYIKDLEQEDKYYACREFNIRLRRENGELKFTIKSKKDGDTRMEIEDFEEVVSFLREKGYVEIENPDREEVDVALEKRFGILGYVSKRGRKYSYATPWGDVYIEVAEVEFRKGRKRRVKTVMEIEYAGSSGDGVKAVENAERFLRKFLRMRKVRWSNKGYLEKM